MIEKRPKMLLNTILAIFLIMTSVAGCTFTGKSHDKITPLTDDELSYFNGDEFFNGEYMNIRNQFLSSLYDAPGKVDLFQLFYCGSGIEDTLTEAEKTAVVEYNGWDIEPDCACTKISRSNMDAVLSKYMGLTLSGTEEIGLENFTYLKEYDAYYYYHGDTNYRAKITFSRGERKGDIIRLFYDDVYFVDGEKVLTLREKDGSYLFVSNVYCETDNPAAPSDLFAASTGDIHDYMPKLLAGESVSDYDLLPCLENFTRTTWLEMDKSYGREWWNSLWVALRDAAVSDMKADSGDQSLSNYYIGKAYLTSDGAYAEGLSDILVLQWDYNRALYSACLKDRFSADEAATLRRSIIYSISCGGSIFALAIPGTGTLSLNAYPVDFPFGFDLAEKSRKSFKAESFGKVTVVESDDLQVTYLNPDEGVYTVITIRTVKEGCSSAGVAIGDTEEALLKSWSDKPLKKMDSISYDDEVWFGKCNLAYAYTPEEGTKSVVFLIKDGLVFGIEIVNGLDGALY
ncbi:MAG: hypothetical protein PHS15_02755 [Clostridiaceae bacterium]|nr:hypothetical protein [Clostridiaceae bacterium]